jgi:hypothetical protein
LRILNVTNNNEIDDNSIKELNLTALYATNCLKITNLNHMNNLKILHAKYAFGNISGITNELNLTELVVDDNNGITNVSHMSNLKILSAI